VVDHHHHANGDEINVDNKGTPMTRSSTFLIQQQLISHSAFFLLTFLKNLRSINSGKIFLRTIDSSRLVLMLAPSLSSTTQLKLLMILLLTLIF
jgi:hypothetical protein